MANEGKITNDLFLEQIRSSVNEDDFENFLHKDITIENLCKGSKHIAKSMLQNSFSATTTDSNLDLEYDISCIHVIIGLYNKFGKCLYEYNKDFLLRDIQILAEDLNYDQIKDTIQELPSFNAYATVMRIYKMDSKDLQKLTDAIKGNTKALEKYTSIIDKQNQKIDALTMAISELKTTIKGNPND